MGVKFQTKEMERTVVYRFKSQKVMKYNFKQKRWKKRINILRIAKRVPVEHPQFAGENN